MKKSLLMVLVCALVGALMFLPTAASAKQYKIGVTVIVAHPALEADQKGFEAAIKEAGLDVVYDYQNAQGEMANAQTIAQKFRNDPSVDLVHSIATPTSQAACKAIKKKPVVYSSVTDPVDAGLVSTMGPAGKNVTGVSDAWPYKAQVELTMEMMPNAKTWGTVYNAGDANSARAVGWLKDIMAAKGLKLVEVTVSTSAEVYTAAQSLNGRCDLIFIISDNTAVSAFESILKVARSKKIPLFGGGTESVERGSIAALGFDYYAVGHAAGVKAAQILKGAKPGDIPSGPATDLIMVVNPGAAKSQGLDLDPKFVKKADRVIE